MRENLVSVFVVVLLLTSACGSNGDPEPAPDGDATGGAIGTEVESSPSTVASTAPPTSESPTTTAFSGPTATTSSIAVDTTVPAVADQPWSPKTVEELVDPVFVVDVGFGFGLPDGWYEQVWMKEGDGQGEIVAGEGVRFTGRGGSTRSGIMTEAPFDVGEYSHLVVAVHGAVIEQTLAGTGWNGREAPLALAVTYIDAAGTTHIGLGEDPLSPTNMFYRGFTALPEDGMFNGVEVTLGAPFVFQFDLMGLDPAPVSIMAVGIEGGGWDPRVGEVFEVMLAAGN